MKKILFRIVGVMAGVILLGNCVGCSNEQSPEKGNTNGIEVETIEVEENVVYWPD